MPKISTAPERRTARRSLDARVADLRELANDLTPPKGGWIGAIRQSLGLPRKVVADRLGVAESTVARIEANERAGTVQMDSLRRVADALGCDVVYALVPRQSLDQTVAEQARRRAAALVASVRHSMVLEDQEPSELALTQMLEDLAAESVDRPGLWDE